jgi:hypothetical protein
VPPFPLALGYIWKAYLRLRRRKSMGFSGFNKVEWTDIDAFMRRAGIRLAPWEIALVEDLDDIFCREMAEGAEATKSEKARAAKDSVKNVAKKSRTVTQERGER